MRDGFIKVAAATPEIRVADCGFNAASICDTIETAAALGVKLLALPELCITGYTCGDLFFQKTALRRSACAENGMRGHTDPGYDSYCRFAGCVRRQAFQLRRGII